MQSASTFCRIRRRIIATLGLNEASVVSCPLASSDCWDNSHRFRFFKEYTTLDICTPLPARRCRVDERVKSPRPSSISFSSRNCCISLSDMFSVPLVNLSKTSGSWPRKREKGWRTVRPVLTPYFPLSFQTMAFYVSHGGSRNNSERSHSVVQLQSRFYNQPRPPCWISCCGAISVLIGHQALIFLAAIKTIKVNQSNWAKLKALRNVKWRHEITLHPSLGEQDTTLKQVFRRIMPFIIFFFFYFARYKDTSCSKCLAGRKKFSGLQEPLLWVTESLSRRN